MVTILGTSIRGWGADVLEDVRGDYSASCPCEGDLGERWNRVGVVKLNFHEEAVRREYQAVHESYRRLYRVTMSIYAF